MVSETDAGRKDTEETGRRRVLLVALVSLAAFGAAVVWLVVTATVGSRDDSRRKRPELLTVERAFPREGRYRGDPYLGSRACEECHPGEVAFHAGSGHASTLRPAGRPAEARALDGLTIADPELEGVQWGYRTSGGLLEIERRAESRVERWVADYAFGSGHHAMTFVNLISSAKPELLEHRLSYYTATKLLGMTPGQDAESRGAEIKVHGNEASAANTLKCFRCHATQLSAKGIEPIDPATMIPNVSCERCHGPGRAHAEAARRKADEAELAMPFGRGRWTAESLHLLCGACHRHPSKAKPGQIRKGDAHLARFQPVGIMQSACYAASDGAFSCVTCHDPHARVSADRRSYDLICKDCHGGAKAVASEHRVVAGRVCIKDPGGRCVECHMPKVDAGQYVLFTDHWIRIRGEADGATAGIKVRGGFDMPDR